uniref:Conserved oligomeric Golgi complex subunit 1 n=1 Tax=Timema cristinae TaxID=61476 RepID=A0A7R9CX41_TIMCR|nr:unnamed protein product [Timema cristinae]
MSAFLFFHERERYRDLIEAADTISDMKKTAEGVISHIEEMSVKCQQLQLRQLYGFKADSAHIKSLSFSQHKNLYATAVQIKILVDIPEQIWSALEQENFILAAQLFLFARHISTGLQLQGSTEGGIDSQKVVQWFPVIVRQWSTISHFLHTILEGCQRTLQSHQLSPQKASSCLSTLVLLEGLTSVELLSKFLELRTQALQQVLPSDQHVSVKVCISTSLRLLVQTIMLLHACFYEEGEITSQCELGMVWKQLRNLVGNDAPSSIELVDIKDSVVYNFLSPLVQQFRPSTSKPVDPVSPDEMRDHVTLWLKWVQVFVQQGVTSLLALVSSVRGLQAIREEAAEVGVIDGWDDICQHLLLSQGPHLWANYFQPLVTQRAKTIISSHWETALADLHDRLRRAADDVGLLMKVMGYTPCVEKLCSALDVQLEKLLQDMQYYVCDAASTDTGELQVHLQECSVANVNRLVEHIKSEYLSQSEENSAVLMAHLLQALCELCPNLHKCFSPSLDIKDTNPLLPRESSKWQEACQLLRQESLQAWQVWQHILSKRLTSLCKNKLNQSYQLANLLDSAPQWEVVSIEEEAEEGRSIQSDIRVPSQPSIPLQGVLRAAAQIINCVAPHTVPRKIHQDIVEHLMSDLLESYKGVSQEGSLCQSQALQYLLDVKYLTMLLLPRDHKILIGKSQEISDKFEEKIDPFDLDVFSQYIQNNIRRSVQKSQCLLGVLIAWPEKLSVVAGLKATSVGSTGENPSILPLCTTAPWFPLLPVTSHHPQASVSKPQLKKAASPKPKGDPSAGDIMRSGAAALFGVMSSDWFGSS